MWQVEIARYASDGFPLHCAVQRPPDGHDNRIHTHDCLELVHVIRGSGVNEIAGVPYAILAGDLFIINVGATHRFRSEDGLAFYNLLFRFELFSEAERAELAAMPAFTRLFFLDGDAADAPVRHKLALSPVQHERIATLFGAITDEIAGAAPGHRVAAKARFAELLVALCRLTADPERQILHLEDLPDGPLARALELLHERYADKLTLGEIGEACGLSANYLGNRFRAATGLPVHEYLNKLRVERARALLEESERSATEIALEVGFADASWFTKVFKRMTGLTPRDYRALRGRRT